MRLPKLRELTEAQKNVYLYAPSDHHILVSGPPGTGKTLIASLRAQELARQKKPVVLGMFNRVLARYSENVGQSAGFTTKTVFTWFREWWLHCGVRPCLKSTSPILIESPYEDREKVKAAGGRWNPEEWKPWWNRRGNRKGAMTVSTEIYSRNPEAFTSWRLWQNPPVQGNKVTSIDWDAAAEHLLEHEEDVANAALNLGTLLIDEGQDFPPGFYKMLKMICSIARMRGVEHPPRCFVLADENQQLTEENSTLEEIAATLGIETANRYMLLDNFRNSREIAELAREFFADVGALPRLPERSSSRPVLLTTRNLAETAGLIRTWVYNNPRKETGVFVFSESSRAAVFEALESELKRAGGQKFALQTYSWNSREQHKAGDLLFDTPDVVTVLNMQSCKGLEFDAVFIVDMHEARIANGGKDRFRMQMFVATSRAREWVSLIGTRDPDLLPELAAKLPGMPYLERTKESTLANRRVTNKAACTTAPPMESSSTQKEEWEIAALAISARRGLTVDDKRNQRGALWIYGGDSLAKELEPLGFTFSLTRNGWWRK